MKRPREVITVFGHLMQTYQAAEAAHPDLMEPYAQALSDAENREAMAKVMRLALAETFRKRYPMPDEFWPKVQQPAEASAS